MVTSSRFARKPFYVDAIQVRSDNMQDVAKWCQGEVRTSEAGEEGGSEKYVKVRVHRPLTDRQTKAFLGDWVLYAGTGFKVYTNKAFEKSFEPVPGSANHSSSSRKTYRSADSGEFVDQDFAEANPDTTVSESQPMRSDADLS